MRPTPWLIRMTAAIATALVLGAPPAQAAELPPAGEARVDTYLQAFLQMTFWPSSTWATKAVQRPAIEKLGPTVRVRMSVSGYEEYLEKLLRREAAMAGLELVFLPNDDKSETLFIEI